MGFFLWLAMHEKYRDMKRLLKDGMCSAQDMRQLYIHSLRCIALPAHIARVLYTFNLYISIWYVSHVH